MIPSFDIQRVLVEPWTESLSLFGWVALMGFFVTAACGLVGNFLILRRMSLVGDAISHSVLPGIAAAYLLFESRSPLVMFLGALVSGILATLTIGWIHRHARVKQDSAIGIVFSTFFALGVVIISLSAGQVELDADCVLYGDLALIGLEEHVQWAGIDWGPHPVVLMGLVLLLLSVLVVVFYKELLAASFDPTLAASLGIRTGFIQYALMASLSLVVVSAFRAVGAILVIAMLILPGATAFLLVKRLPAMLGLSLLHAALSAVIGMHLGVWLDCSFAAAMVVAGALLFASAVLIGKVRKWRLNRAASRACIDDK